MKKISVKAFVTIGMLSAISYVLMILNFPLPMFPTWLKIDFSDIPALIGAIIMGPWAGVLIELIKNILDVISTGSETGVPVGHIANFATGISFILPTYYIYRKVKTQKGLTVALLTASVITALVMGVLNYFVFIPMYSIFMGFELPKSIVLSAILPFNLLKCLLISMVFMLLYMRMKDWIHKQQSAY